MHLLVVRQPIFNRWKRVVGYEWLFHAFEQGEAPTGDERSSQVVDAYLHRFHPALLTGGKTVVIPAPRSFLLKD